MTIKEIEIKPSKNCDMCDWKTNYTCCDCERIQGGSGLHYNDYDYFVRLTNGKKDYINRYEKPQASSLKRHETATILYDNVKKEKNI